MTGRVWVCQGLDRINLGSRICASPVAAGSAMYLAASECWLWTVGQGEVEARSNRD
jgi:hypothetical protein